MKADKLIGLLCAVGSAICNGSFTSPFKTQKIAQLNIHPIIFQLYVCIGIFLSSWFVLPFIISKGEDEQYNFMRIFTVYGILAGFLFVIAVSCSFLAIDCIGIALAQSIWGGLAIVVSWVWGAICFHELPSNVTLSVFALILLVLSVIGIAFSESIADRFLRQEDDEQQNDTFCSNELTPLTSMMLDEMRDNKNDETTDSFSSSRRSNSSKEKKFIQGLLWSFTVGISGGSILAPLHFVPPAKEGLVFLPSFSIGTIVLSPLVVLIWLTMSPNSFSLLSIIQNIKDGALLMGVLSGFIWNIGNLLSIIAIPKIGYGVAYPIMQCAIVISGFWGIYVFNEIESSNNQSHCQIIVFWTCSTIIIIGGLCLSIAQ